MTHNEKRTAWWKEGVLALVSGTLFGVASVVVGHPLDTIKTKMQVVEKYRGFGMIQSIKQLYRSEGIRGFYRGAVPPLIGSSMFRASQFAVFEALYTKWQHNLYFTKKIPFTGDLEIRVILGGIASGTARALIECPFEYSKVRGQTHLSWKLINIYQGFTALWLRCTGTLVSYFIMVDSFRRHTNLYKYEYSLFFMNGFCASVAFTIMWPVEVAKNELQTMEPEQQKRSSIPHVLRHRVQNTGLVQGLYSGLLPGLTGIFVRNGVAMVVMIKAQKLFTHYGLRN
jgi:solute carrier family 25 carnitine/acylcarnitine transporter 20/29